MQKYKEFFDSIDILNESSPGTRGNKNKKAARKLAARQNAAKPKTKQNKNEQGTAKDKAVNQPPVKPSPRTTKPATNNQQPPVKPAAQPATKTAEKPSAPPTMVNVEKPIAQPAAGTIEKTAAPPAAGNDKNSETQPDAETTMQEDVAKTPSDKNSEQEPANQPKDFSNIFYGYIDKDEINTNESQRLQELFINWFRGLTGDLETRYNTIIDKSATVKFQPDMKDEVALIALKLNSKFSEFLKKNATNMSEPYNEYALFEIANLNNVTEDHKVASVPLLVDAVDNGKLHLNLAFREFDYGISNYLEAYTNSIAATKAVATSISQETFNNFNTNKNPQIVRNVFLNKFLPTSKLAGKANLFKNSEKLTAVSDKKGGILLGFPFLIPTAKKIAKATGATEAATSLLVKIYNPNPSELLDITAEQLLKWSNDITILPKLFDYNLPENASILNILLSNSVESITKDAQVQKSADSYNTFTVNQINMLEKELNKYAQKHISRDIYKPITELFKPNYYPKISVRQSLGDFKGYQESSSYIKMYKLLEAEQSTNVSTAAFSIRFEYSPKAVSKDSEKEGVEIKKGFEKGNEEVLKALEVSKNNIAYYLNRSHRSLGRSVSDFTRETRDDLKDAAKYGASLAKEGSEKLADLAKEGSEKIVDLAKEGSEKVADLAKKGYEKAAPVVKQAAQDIGDATKRAAVKAADLAKEGYEKAAPVVKQAAGKAKDATGKALGKAADFIKSAYQYDESTDLQEFFDNLETLNEKKPVKKIKVDGTTVNIRIVAGSNSNIRIINECVAEVPILVEKVTEKDSLKKKMSNAGKSVAKGYKAFNNYAGNIVV